MSSARVRVEGVREDLRVGCPRLDLELVEGVGEGGCPRLELELKELEKVRGRCTRLEMELVEGVEEDCEGCRVLGWSWSWLKELEKKRGVSSVGVGVG